jgi:hypothetical protein
MFGMNLGSIFGGVRIVDDQNLVVENGEGGEARDELPYLW